VWTLLHSKSSVPRERKVEVTLRPPYISSYLFWITLPHEVIALALFNRKIVFNLLFESTSRALIEFSLSYVRNGFSSVSRFRIIASNFRPPPDLPLLSGQWLDFRRLLF
jgi:hypothetical protein